MYIQDLTEVLHLLIQDTTGICQKVTSSGLVNLLRFSYASINMFTIAVLTVDSKFINVTYEVSPPFIPEISTFVTSFIVQIICIYLAWIL